MNYQTNFREAGRSLTAQGRRMTKIGLAMLLVLLGSLALNGVAFAQDVTVTTITACGNDDALQEAIGNGGVITFDCGTATIPIADEITINSDVTIDGGGTITLDGGNSRRLFNVGLGQRLTVQNITLSNGNAADGAGILNSGGNVWVINSTLTSHSCNGSGNVGCAILNDGTSADLVVVDSEFTDNQANNGRGGAIANEMGTVEIYQSRFTSNSAEQGGAISNRQGINVTVVNSTFTENNASDTGGAIFVNDGDVSIVDSTFETNVASPGGGIYYIGDSVGDDLNISGSLFRDNDGGNSTNGGGLFISNAVAVISNTTITGNEANNGGGLFIDSKEGQTNNVTILNSTIAYNTAISNNGGGILSQNEGNTDNVAIVMRNTILADNNPANCSGMFELASGTGNLESSTNTCTGGTIGDPDLDGLNDNGGPTLTFAIPDADSPAEGNSTNCPDTDQRGYTRPNGACDTGAFEFNATPPDPSTITNVMTDTNPANGEPVYELTITGENFSTDSVVQFNGQPLATQYDSDTQLTAYVPIDDYVGLAEICVETDGVCEGKLESLDGSKIPPLGMTLSGPTTVLVNQSYAYTATVSPMDTTLPLTYNWTETEDGEFPRPDQNSVVNTVIYDWTSVGTKTITVVASNVYSQVTDTLVITVGKAPSEEDVTTDNPDSTTGQVGVPYTYTVSIDPDTTTPITYVWQATDQNAITQTDNAVTTTAPYTWTEPGLKLITLTIQNEFGTTTETFEILISLNPVTVTLTGPTLGTTDTGYTFVATVTPTTTNVPLTFTWQAVEAITPTVTNSVDRLTDTQTFQWDSAGVKSIAVTVSSPEVDGLTSYTIALQIPPTSVVISGTTQAVPNVSYDFVATVNAEATTPLTYSWQATDIALPTVVITDDLTNLLPLQWSTTGEKVITVTVSNQQGSVSDIHLVQVANQPLSLTLTGPTVGSINQPYTFTATVADGSAIPITYSWQATEQSDSMQTSGLSDTLSLTWATTGTKAITVTADNGFGTAQQAAITVDLSIGPTGVVITGPTSGQVEQVYAFTATVSPTNLQQPVTYTWQATSLTETVQLDGGLSNSITLTWATTGTKIITVTADNGLNTATAVQTISLSAAEVSQPLVSVSITGPMTVMVRESYTYTARVSPTTALRPITYSWQTENESSIQIEEEQPLDPANSSVTTSFSWSTGGVKQITMTARNALTSVMDVYSVTVIQPIEAITITAPLTGVVGVTYTFGTSISPLDATTPITYTWTPTPTLGQGTMAVSYTWAMTGTRVITVTALNAGGRVTDTHLITLTMAAVVEENPRIYLPILLR